MTQKFIMQSCGVSADRLGRRRHLSKPSTTVCLWWKSRRPWGPGAQINEFFLVPISKIVRSAVLCCKHET